MYKWLLTNDLNGSVLLESDKFQFEILIIWWVSL